MIGLDHLWMLAAALAVDALLGDPDFIWRKVPHPVALIGRLIDWLDRTLNRRATDRSCAESPAPWRSCSSFRSRQQSVSAWNMALPASPMAGSV